MPSPHPADLLDIRQGGEKGAGACWSSARINLFSKAVSQNMFTIRHSGESRNPGALILKAILDPGFHRGDEKGEK
jgi:hypothetical protein